MNPHKKGEWKKALNRQRCRRRKDLKIRPWEDGREANNTSSAVPFPAVVRKRKGGGTFKGSSPAMP
jgi:hypothetical protein